jgi:hypothetical protein
VENQFDPPPEVEAWRRIALNRAADVRAAYLSTCRAAGAPLVSPDLDGALSRLVESLDRLDAVRREELIEKRRPDAVR